MKACPYRKAFYEKLGSPPDKVDVELGTWLTALDGILKHMNAFYEKGGYGKAIWKHSLVIPTVIKEMELTQRNLILFACGIDQGGIKCDNIERTSSHCLPRGWSNTNSFLAFTLATKPSTFCMYHGQGGLFPRDIKCGNIKITSQYLLRGWTVL